MPITPKVKRLTRVKLLKEIRSMLHNRNPRKVKENFSKIAKNLEIKSSSNNNRFHNKSASKVVKTIALCLEYRRIYLKGIIVVTLESLLLILLQ